MNKRELQNRLVKFAALIIDIAEELPSSFAAIHLGKQLIRSGTSPALNYGESNAAESTADFVHKLKIVLKELNETYICLQILIERKYGNKTKILAGHKEANELISIFTASLKTMHANRSKQPPKS